MPLCHPLVCVYFCVTVSVVCIFSPFPSLIPPHGNCIGCIYKLQAESIFEMPINAAWVVYINHDFEHRLLTKYRSI